MDISSASIEVVFDSLDTEKKGFITQEEFLDKLGEFFGDMDAVSQDEIICKLKAVLNPETDKLYLDDFRRCIQAISGKSSHKDEPTNPTPNSLNISEPAMEPLHHRSSKEDVFYVDDGGIRGGKSIDTSSSPSNSDTGSYCPTDAGNGSTWDSTVAVCDWSSDSRQQQQLLLSARRQGHDLLRSGRSSLANVLQLGQTGMLGEDDVSSTAGDSGLLLCGSSAAAEEVDRLVGQQDQLRAEVESLRVGLEASEARYSRAHEEASGLMDKIHSLEDQLRDVQLSCRDMIDTKEKQLSMKVMRIERDKDTEIEQYKESLFRQDVIRRLSALETEYSASKSELNRLRSEKDAALKEKGHLENRLIDAESRWRSLQMTLDEYRAVTGKQLADLHRERDKAHSTMEELYEELEMTRVKLRDSQNPGNSRPPSVRPRAVSLVASPVASNSQAFPTSPSPGELEEVIRRLTGENKNLVEQLQETQAELMSHRLDLVGHNRELPIVDPLMRHTDTAGADGAEGGPISLADEMGLSGLKNALSAERETNARLRIYIDQLLLRVMEQNTLGVLEVGGFQRNAVRTQMQKGNAGTGGSAEKPNAHAVRQRVASFFTGIKRS